MRIGRRNSQSKSEVMYIPAKIGGDGDTIPHASIDGFISFCTKFKYLGRIVISDLDDKIVIEKAHL